MKSFIDTNLFVYASYRRYPQHEKAKTFLKGCTEGVDRYYLSWGVAYEYLRLVTHPKLFVGETLTFEKALKNVLQFMDFPTVEILQETAEHSKCLSQLEKEGVLLQGNLLHDAHSVALMKEHDIRRIYTADTDFHKFKGLQVVNPVY